MIKAPYNFVVESVRRNNHSKKQAKQSALFLLGLGNKSSKQTGLDRAKNIPNFTI
jgi:hypothetical protein